MSTAKGISALGTALGSNAAPCVRSAARAARCDWQVGVAEGVGAEPIVILLSAVLRDRR